MDPVSASGDLIRQAQTGDHRAFAALVGGCDEKMRRLAYRLLGSQAAMDDALQDAYLKAFRTLGSYDGHRSAFSTWLYTVVYSTCLDHLRSRKRRSEINLDTIVEPASSDDHTERQADQDALDTALRDLPPDQAAAVILVDGDGCSYDEAAAILGARAGTIASRLNRAHKTLRALGCGARSFTETAPVIAAPRQRLTDRAAGGPRPTRIAGHRFEVLRLVRRSMLRSVDVSQKLERWLIGDERQACP